MKLSQVNWERLRVLGSVYRHQSIKLAADELNVTRAAVSIQIRRLEEELGEELFVRAHRVIRPTRLAVNLYTIIEKFEDSLRISLENLEKRRKNLSGPVRIGIPQTFGVRFVLPLLAEFNKEFPGVRFDTKLELTFPMLQMLAQEKLDLAILDLADIFVDRKSVRLRSLASEVQVLAAHPKLHERLGPPSLEEVTGFPFVAYSAEGAAIKAWFRAIFNKVPSRLNIAISIADMDGIITAVKNQMGIGLIPRYLIERDLSRGTLKEIKTKKKYVNQMKLVTPSFAQPDPLVQIVESFLLKNLKLSL